MDFFMILKDWCSYCGECAGVCPKNLILVKEADVIFNDEECGHKCTMCIDACPLNAIVKE